MPVCAAPAWRCGVAWPRASCEQWLQVVTTLSNRWAARFLPRRHFRQDTTRVLQGELRRRAMRVSRITEMERRRRLCPAVFWMVLEHLLVSGVTGTPHASHVAWGILSAG